MSRFYGSIEGSARTEATRQGNAKSGIFGHIRGRDIGASVTMRVNSDGEDEVRVLLTSGSSGYESSILIGVFTEADREKVTAAAAGLQWCGDCERPMQHRHPERLDTELELGRISNYSAWECEGCGKAIEKIWRPGDD